MPKILLIGELGRDVFVQSSVTRICPEAPVPVINPISRSSTDGMAANVYANLVSLGVPAQEITAIYPDTAITKTRYVDEQSGYIVTRIDENDVVAESERFDCLSDLPLDLATFSGIVISDYAKSFIDAAGIQCVASRAKALGVPTFLDTKKILSEFSKDVTFVKINDREYKAQLAAGVPPTFFCENIIVTLGGKGSWWANRMLTVPVKEVQVSQLSGAGDSYLAGFVVEYLKSGDVPKAMDYGNRVARIAVSRRGVVAVDWRDVE